MAELMKLAEGGERINLHSPGAKDDAGKAMAGLMVEGFAGALQAVAEITTYGAMKYTPNGWRSVPYARRRYTDALYRHLLAYAAGERCDPESGYPHLAHAAWNLLALLELDQNAEPPHGGPI